MVVRFTATCVMNANPKTYKIVFLLPWILVGLTMTNIDGGLGQLTNINRSQILLRSPLTEGRRTLDLIINAVFRNCIKKYLSNKPCQL
jgi:hypothetical protein